ncbi:hypothetical protein ES703_109371 [subsurface metagenome]
MKTIDISGMGGGYEAGCQLMLLRGLKYLKEHPDFDFSVYKSFKNIYGICEGEGDKAKELDEVITKGVEPSGAMHQAVISHLAYIHKHGHDAWIAEAKNHHRKPYEMPSEEELENQILIAHIEWQLKLDGGYNPLAELFKRVPMEDVITVDPNDPESIKRAAEEIARRISN